MNILNAFPSTSIKASDLQGKTRTLTIMDCRMDKIGDDEKPFLFFRETDKSLVLNKTNSQALADAYTPETSSWIGKPIEMFSMKVSYAGSMVDGIRLRIPDAAVQYEAEQKANAATLDESIPF